ncbi:LacI family DNA-binding transcriptional regulator [Solibacillus silvestris]|uniref:LacI family DNA-binding transcriptional regulator n=1 Tax=Solibacillus silvestris TaxID=76853 RepID=UPI003F7FB7D3
MVTSKDVAKYAGVSQATVSRVLNTPEVVKKETVNKVMNAINDLNYIPNANARSLVQNKIGTIILLSGPLSNPFFVDTTSVIVNYASKMDYRVQVQFVNDNNLEKAYSNALEQKNDGIILSCILEDDPIFEKLKGLGIPFITYNRKHKLNENFVEIDNFHAGELSFKYMRELGHENIAWIGGQLNVTTFKNRYEGFIHAMKEGNMPIDPSYIVHNAVSKSDLEDAIYNLLHLRVPPTAICAATDSIALDLIDIAKKANISIPEELSIMGIDNVEISQHGMIELTTVGSKYKKNLGYIAIQELISMIDGKNNSCICITEPVKLFVRKTTQRLK